MEPLADDFSGIAARLAALEGRPDTDQNAKDFDTTTLRIKAVEYMIQERQLAEGFGYNVREAVLRELNQEQFIEPPLDGDNLDFNRYELRRVFLVNELWNISSQGAKHHADLVRHVARHFVRHIRESEPPGIFGLLFEQPPTPVFKASADKNHTVTIGVKWRWVRVVNSY